MVIMVLLKLAFTCATPAVMFLRSLLRRRCGAWAIEIPTILYAADERSEEACLLLLTGDRPGLALASARVGVRALAANREATAMAKPAVAGEIHQPLDVHRGLAAQIAFD